MELPEVHLRKSGTLTLLGNQPCNLSKSGSGYAFYIHRVFKFFLQIFGKSPKTLPVAV